MSEFKSYIGVKLIKAKPATFGEAQAVLKRPATEKDPAQDTPGYLVQYTDGYTSWSPKDIFDESHFDYDDYYAAIERNCMTDVWRGVQTNNIYLPKPPGASATIADNVITTRTQAIAGDQTYTDVTAILVNLHYQNASTWSVMPGKLRGGWPRAP